MFTAASICCCYVFLSWDPVCFDSYYPCMLITFMLCSYWWGKSWYRKTSEELALCCVYLFALVMCGHSSIILFACFSVIPVLETMMKIREKLYWNPLVPRQSRFCYQLLFNWTRYFIDFWCLLSLERCLLVCIFYLTGPKCILQEVWGAVLCDPGGGCVGGEPVLGIWSDDCFDCFIY